MLVVELASGPARGAWIEIPLSVLSAPALSGRAPQGARGLKFFLRRPRRSPDRRRAPQGARGLKLTLDQSSKLLGLDVAPRKGRVD